MIQKLLKSLYFFILIINSDQNEDKLLAVVTFSRHGQRSPMASYPKDPLKIKWPVNPGQLLNEGKMQHYKLGQYLRQHYRNFLPEIYSEAEFLAQSLEHDRVVMSALATLAGLYPPKGYQIWNPELDWQPIPVRHMPAYYAFTVLHNKHCAKYSKKWRNYWIKALDAKTLELFSYLQNHTGIKIDETVPVNAGVVMDILRLQAEYGYKIPDWGKEIYPQVENFSVSKIYHSLHFDQEMLRLGCGGFFHEIITTFQSFIDNVLGNSSSTNTEDKLESIKFQMNSGHLMKMFFGHDTNVINLLVATGNYNTFNNWHFVDYGATLIFELHRLNEEFNVQLFYIKNPVKEPIMIPLAIQNCSNQHQCEFNEFKSLFRDIVVETEEEWMKECNNLNKLLSSAGAINFNCFIYAFLIILTTIHV